MQLKGKYIIIGILIVAIVVMVGVVWHASNKPVSFLNTPSPTPDPNPSFSSTPFPISSASESPTPIPDTRTWGERLRDKTIPEVPGIKWQTYTNQKYGFEMEYPEGWAIERRGKNPHAVDSYHFYPKNTNPYPSIFGLIIYRGTLREFLSKNSSIFKKRFDAQGVIPDTTINGVDLFIEEDGMSSQVLFSVNFERDGYTYSFGGSFGQNEDMRKIMEHALKIFRFVK